MAASTRRIASTASHGVAARGRSRRRCSILAALFVCLLSGCSSTPWRKVPLDAATGFYQSARLSYRLDAGKLQQPLDVARIEAQGVRFDQVASSPLPEQSLGTLSIVYPHPDGRAGMAQAKFVLDSSQAKPKSSPSLNPFAKKTTTPAVATSQAEIHEVWLFDLPSAESDKYFKLVCEHNFFNTDRPDAVGAQLTVSINGREMAKPWEQVAELNALVQRIRREGQLVSYSRPAAPAGPHQGAITSVKAYSDLLVQSGASPTSAIAAGQTESAFSMTPPAARVDNLARVPGATR